MRGEYSPVPPSFDGRIARLVDQMLERDPRRRPLIDEILTTPVVRSFLGSYASVRVPRGPPQSSEEVMLRQQLHAFGVANTVNHSCATLSAPPSSTSVGVPEHSPTSRGKPTPSLASPPVPRMRQSQPILVPPDSPPSVSPSYYVGTQSSGVSSARLQSQSQVPAHLQAEARHLEPSNVDDMRDKTVNEIENEVKRLRRLVQIEMAQTGGTATPPRHHFGAQPAQVSPQMVRTQPLNQPPRRHGPDQKMQAPPPASYFNPRESPQLVRSPAGAAAAMALSNPSVSPTRRSALAEAQHRNKLHSTCVNALGAKAYGQIYAYYSAVPSQLRDPQRVVNMVQDRSLWPILPMVDEVVQWDNSIDLAQRSPHHVQHHHQHAVF